LLAGVPLYFYWSRSKKTNPISEGHG
jgi:hypothetical protein